MKNGTNFLQNFVPDYDATVVDRILKAGIVFHIYNMFIIIIICL